MPQKPWWLESLSPVPGKPARAGLFEGLLLVLFVVCAIYTVLALRDDNRRTAEAPATIVSTQPQLSTGRAPQSGLMVGYSFRTPDGATHEDEAFRLWTIEQAQAAKVCYDPADSANNILVEPSLACPR